MTRTSKAACTGLVTLLVAAGCGTQIIAQPVRPQAVERLRDELQGETATVVYTQPAAAPNAEAPVVTRTGRLQIDRDVIRLVEGEQNTPISFQQVRRIEQPSTAAGIGTGAVAGALVAGLGAGLWANTSINADHCFCNGPQIVAFVTILAAIPGAIAGGLVGWLVGGTDNWRFVPAPAR